MKRFALAAALIVGSTAVTAADDPIATRQDIMKNTGGAIGVLAKMAKEEMPFDATSALLAVRTIHVAGIGFPLFFPEGSETGGDTEAAPAIWEDMAGFREAGANMVRVTGDIIELPPTSLDELRESLGMIGKTCQSCHEDYRIEKDG